uniref:Uncharacterized protein n=1 Tax=Meloidogyne hapla TaxID=6305 RepID=A0A1I8AZS2_MELHA
MVGCSPYFGELSGSIPTILSIFFDSRCLRNGGHRLRDNIGGCTRHADCNILVGRIPELQQIGDNQQILCQQKSCCLMPRTLPIGFTDWAQAIE